jgi:hypothetical protein
MQHGGEQPGGSDPGPVLGRAGGGGRGGGVARLPALRLPPESVPHAAAQPPTATERLKGESAKLNIWWPMPLFLDIYFKYRYRYNIKVDEEKIDIYTIFRLGLVLSARCGLEAWMLWICIDVIVLGFK